jgi:hypothetical protein
MANQKSVLAVLFPNMLYLDFNGPLTAMVLTQEYPYKAIPRGEGEKMKRKEKERGRNKVDKENSNHKSVLVTVLSISIQNKIMYCSFHSNENKMRMR